MYSETCQIISHMGSPVQESCTPGSTGGVFREGHVYQPKPHVRIFCEGRTTVRGASTRPQKMIHDPHTHHSNFLNV